MNPLTRRSLLAAAAVVPLGAAATHATIITDWESFRAKFVMPDGRVVDTGNHQISHSEGQGYAMLTAVRANDHASFERILAWTTANLRRPDDALLSWRWQPNSRPNVTDLNNATDGDIFVAWALLLGAEKWRNSAYRRLGQAIGRDILRRCVVNIGQRWLLLPGAYGFRNAERVVVNLSYYAFQALRKIAEYVPDPIWRQLEVDGLRLMRDSRFGTFLLPPDWIELPVVGGRPMLARGWPARFSFDAVRIPLNLCWSGLTHEPPVASAVAFWSRRTDAGMPAWTDLRTNQGPSYAASDGVQAVARFATAAIQGRGQAVSFPSVAAAPDYYSAVLIMKAKMAWQDLAMLKQTPDARIAAPVSPTVISSR